MSRAFIAAVAMLVAGAATGERRLTLADYRDKWAGKTVLAELLFWPSNGVPVCLMSPIELLTTGK